MTQLLLEGQGEPDARVVLTCWHEAAVRRAELGRTSDGWYEAVYCSTCRRRRAIVSLSYATPAGTA